jgi:hypothetical protein
LSKVWFNLSHTVALVDATLRCGSLCGQESWDASALKKGNWKRCHWYSRTAKRASMGSKFLP